MRQTYFLLLIAILTVKALLMIGIILFAQIGLGPDEAQYWTWSQQLDWGYYSKPPAIAWQIGLGIKLFGNTELGVRFLSIVLSFLISLAVYWLAITCRLQQRTSFWAGLIMAFSPLGMLSSLFAITDVGMTLFWTLGCISIAHALAKGKPANYYALGFLIALGALFKWPIYLLWLVIIVTAYFYRFLFSAHLIGGIAISLLGLLPSLKWNIEHHWVTFRHVSRTVTGHHENEGYPALFHGNFFEFLASQAMLLSPILFILLIFAGILFIKHRKEISPPIQFCGASSLIILAFYLLSALFQKMQGNWCDFIYPSAIVFLCWYAFERTHGAFWAYTGTALALLISIIGLSIPYIQSQGLLSQFPIPYKWNLFRHNVGWNRIKETLDAAGYDPEKHFLFGDKYQTTSILSFYGPSQKRAYFLNLNGIRKNQFSFWPSMADEQKGNTGFFVLPENVPHLEKDINERVAFYRGALSQYCKKVEFLGVKPLFNAYGTMAKGAFIFKCEDYNGLMPIDPELY